MTPANHDGVTSEGLGAGGRVYQYQFTDTKFSDTNGLHPWNATR
jgi:hypothetical protein